MDEAYILLNVPHSAGPEEIENAYQTRKAQLDSEAPERGTAEWEALCVRKKALDEAYRHASYAVWMPRRAGVGFARATARTTDGTTTPFFPSGLGGRLALSLAAVFLMPFLVPTVLSGLVPRNLRGIVYFLGVSVALFSCAFPLLTRFVFPRRAGGALFCFPVAVVCSDLMVSAFLYFLSPTRAAFTYIPVFYVIGWAALFPLLQAHWAILTFSSPAASPSRASSFGRLAAYTVILAFTVAVSIGASLAWNGRDSGPVVAGRGDSLGNVLEEPWRTLDVTDAGTLELPQSWHVAGDGRLHEVPHGRVVQYTREALTAYPYGEKDQGFDYAFEVLVYWWAQGDGQKVSPPDGTLDRLLEHRLESLRQSHPDIVVLQKEQGGYGGRAVLVLTAETYTPQGVVVRFKNVALQHGHKVYFLTTSHPSGDAEDWERILDRVLSLWRMEGR